MPDLNDWNIAAASNNDAPPDGWPENMNYSEVNNSAREGMAVMRRFFGDINGSLAAGGSADAYTLTLNAGYSAYFDGMMFSCTIPAANATTTPTLNVNAIGAQTITDYAGNALNVGDLVVGGLYMFMYDGTNLRLMAGAGDANLARTEEQDFVATLTCGTSGTVTLNVAADTLHFKKVGKVVFVTGTLQVSSVSSPTGSIQINSLPYSLASLTDASENVITPIFSQNAVSVGEGFVFAGSMSSGVADRLTISIAAGGLAAPEMKANTTLNFDFHYFTT